MAPKYLRYNIWDPASDFTPNTADWTESAEQLVEPPQDESEDEEVTKTIVENPHLFKIVTPIRVDIFESYLQTHPNVTFVASVCKGLREGFWPWASTAKPGYPLINDESKPPPADEDRAKFLREQRDVEVEKGHFHWNLDQICCLGCTACQFMQCQNPTRRTTGSSRTRAVVNIR